MDGIGCISRGSSGPLVAQISAHWSTFQLWIPVAVSLISVKPLLFPLSSPFFSLLSQREANGSFNTIEDSGLDAPFVNAVYDALLRTVSFTFTFHRQSELAAQQVDVAAAVLSLRTSRRWS